MRVRVNWPLVVLVLGALAIVCGVWLTLVLTHNVGVDSLKILAGFVTGLAGGGSLPLATWWKEKRFELDTDSDPPGGNDGTRTR